MSVGVSASRRLTVVLILSFLYTKLWFVIKLNVILPVNILDKQGSKAWVLSRIFVEAGWNLFLSFGNHTLQKHNIQFIPNVTNFNLNWLENFISGGKKNKKEKFMGWIYVRKWELAVCHIPTHGSSRTFTKHTALECTLLGELKLGVLKLSAQAGLLFWVW